MEHYQESRLTCYRAQVLLAWTSSAFVNVFAPHAFHTGIPEIKVILGGYEMHGFLSPMTLVIKSLGLPLAVASGLSLGKEGPLVHVACCVGDAALRPFRALRGNGGGPRMLLIPLEPYLMFSVVTL